MYHPVISSFGFSISWAIFSVISKVIQKKGYYLLSPSGAPGNSMLIVDWIDKEGTELCFHANESLCDDHKFWVFFLAARTNCFSALPIFLRHAQFSETLRRH
jgi:hypothetical protein